MLTEEFGEGAGFGPGVSGVREAWQASLSYNGLSKRSLVLGGVNTGPQ